MNKLFLFALTSLGMLASLRCDQVIPLFRSARQRRHDGGSR